ncbi:hypothetical protein CV945_01970 [Geobacillus sp. Manikaran-105]|uniref:hypothetical protein n=1 Tax=unclassified Geobacillus TaxID=2642459 RepID=UPI000C2894DB|nr:hypothetical protein [Geobacillus sp. Manikaran-105]PJW15565.1 hypothetical protein CV945_01970 [Geobacillus sp. Manikaran-105]
MSQELKELLRSVLQEELKPVHDRLERLEGTVGHIRQDVSQLQKEVTQLQEGQRTLETTVSQIQKDVAQLQEGQKALQRDVAQLQEGQRTLETTVSQIQKDITQLQQGQQTLENEMAGMKQTQERILEELRVSKHNQALILNDVTSIRKSVDVTVSYLQRRSDVMFDKLIDHEKEILNLKSKMPN